MRFFAAPLIVLAAVASSVLAQAAGNEFVDDVLARDDSFAGEKITAREFSDIHSRHADEIFEAKRDLERLERRSRSVCYAGCNVFTGHNKVACWRKCDAIWGSHP
ncbi:hypothetical protein D9613_008601 [Agrocybe pediades]|uniref:Uncharacterized protein n=1 Tax=Agrocybe pediades TaxID=84607 RepID=A0A8H4QTQ6_9AGAR|nr:hypothetical protein D9613_008601 [Agrocybe pediades]KAF9561411.1 hypothetical protein CPC08DRAFT_707388 [Agrocybe pediades]